MKDTVVTLNADKLTKFLHDETFDVGNAHIEVTLPNAIKLCKVLESIIKQIEWKLLEMEEKEVDSVDERLAGE